MNHTIGFTIGNNASAAEVELLITDIRRHFGLSTESVPATAVLAAQQGSTTAGAEAQQGTTASVELDSNGLPYDERIHSGTRGKNQDGSWKKRKGVDQGTVAQVTAELQALMGAKAPTTAPTLPPVAATTPSLPTPTLPSIPSIPTLPTTETKYQQFTRYIGTILVGPENPNGRVDGAWVNQVIENYGVPGGLANLAAREDLIDTIRAAIEGALAA